MLQKISEITSSLPALESGARTGVSTGSDGSARRLTINPDVARARLLAKPPEANDRNLLAWLESSLSVVAKPRARMMFPPTGGYYARVDGFDVAGLTGMTRQQAIDAVESAMTPQTVEACEELVATLHAVTARRGDDEAGLSVAMTLYAGCLAQYPADIAKAVCMTFALRKARPNWFPSLSELNEACEQAAAQRQALLHALRSSPSATQQDKAA